MQQKVYAYGRSWIAWFLEPLQLLVIAQVTFLSVGIPYLNFNVGWFDVVVAVGVAVTTEFLATYIRARYTGSTFHPFFPSSALTAALGIGIFFRASHPAYFALAALIAILSKYVIQRGGRHIFNPSNIAIVSLVFLAPFATTIEFTQWGNSPYVYAAVLAISLGIAYRAGVIVTTLSFVMSYTALLLIWLPLSPSLFSLHHYGLIGPSFVLFASFMISDPRTSPGGFYPRIVHGISIALLYFSLEASGVRYALFVASFGVAFFNAVLPFLMPTRIASLTERLPNIATGVLAFILCVSAYVTLASQHSVRPTFIRPSIDFLLFGVEGSGIMSCEGNSLFRASTRSGLENSPSAMGAAWGDYNLDGFDDIFVSGYWDASRLYRNNGDGTFTDVSRQVGLPEKNSTSAYFSDYDNDGMQDLFVFDARPAFSSKNPEPLSFERKVRVYKNFGGLFREVTQDVGLSAYESAFGAAAASFADYDGNGTLDVVIVDSGLRRDLYVGKNNALKKTLSDPYIKKSTSVVCGIDAGKLIQHHPDLGTSVEDIIGTELFLDQQGCLIVTRAIDLGSDVTTGEWMSNAPVIDALLHIPGRARLFINTGQRFTEDTGFASTVTGIIRAEESTSRDAQEEGTHPYTRVSGAFFQPISFDYDNDGRTDVFLTSDFGANLLLKNERGLKFRDATKEAGLDYYGSGMGVAIGDYDSDGFADLFVTNSLTDFVFRNKGNGTFSFVTDELRLGATGVGWGIALLDYDLDGLEDVYAANGDNIRSSLEPDPQLQRPLLRRDSLYRNLGDGTFVDRSGIDMCSDTATGFPLATSDFDNDGDPDVFIGNAPVYGGAPELNSFMENRLPHVDTHFISIRLRGVTNNSAGIGSKVSVTSGDTTRTKFLVLGGSFRSQNSSTLLFGLGANEAPVDVRIEWPSGKITERKNVGVDRMVTISE